MKIYKNKKQTSKVSIHKEVLTEEKNITVPIKREELVIEKTFFDSQFHNKSDAHTKTLKKEIPHISINGDAKIVDKKIPKKYRS